ncbi:MAG: hypothetical protein HDS85_02525 [Bacteroidales bacterium]|nr:hypothetical protein [Bacteroidales bacterium]
MKLPFISTHRLLIASLSSLAISLPAFAHKQDGHGIHHTEMADHEEIGEALAHNAPAEFANPPHFIFKSHNQKFVIGLGGFLKATASFDFGSPTDNPTDFLVSDIPVGQAKGNGAKMQFSAQSSALFANAIFNPGKNQVGAFIGFDFRGGNYVPVLQYGFVKYRGFQSGYDITLFADDAVAPPSIDAQGPNSYLGITTPGVRFTTSFGKQKQWSAGVGLEMPQAAYPADDAVAVVNQRIPDIPAFIRYSWNESSSWLRLAAILRNMTYRDLVKETNRTSTGWGLALSGNVGIIPDKLSFIFQGAYGHGISSYFQDLNGAVEEDLFASTDHPGKMKAAPAWGGFAGFQYNFSSKCYASASYSHLRIYDNKTMAAADDYRYGQYILANFFYDINSYLTWGVEYIYGRKMNMNGANAHDNRLQTMLQFSF